jgi:cytochrome c oxidase subunit I+III
VATSSVFTALGETTVAAVPNPHPSAGPASASRHAGEAALADRLERIWSSPPTLLGWVGTVDHKKIGRRYLVTSVAFLLVGGLEALLMRLQLIGPDRRLLSPEAYNQVFTMHGLTMIMWYAAPVQRRRRPQPSICQPGTHPRGTRK